MSKDKISREPPKKPWWIRVANFVSNLLKTQAELKREQEIKELNTYGHEFHVLQQFTSGMDDQNYRNDLTKRLASGSIQVRTYLSNYLIQIKNQLDEGKIPNNVEDLLTKLRSVIDEVDNMKRGIDWNLGDKEVSGSWARWREGMVTGIYQVTDKITALKERKSVERVDVDISSLSLPVNRSNEFRKLLNFLEQGLTDDNFRAQLKTQLARGREDIVLNIPAYLSQEMKNLQNGEVTEGLPARLVKLKSLLEEVEQMPVKGADWKTAGLDETKSSTSWFTAMRNSIKRLEGMIAKIQSPEQTVAVTQESDRGAPVIEGRVQETGSMAQPNPPQEEVSARSSDSPETSTRPAQGVPHHPKEKLKIPAHSRRQPVPRGKVENPTQGETGDSARAKDEQVTQQPMRARTQARPKAPPTQSGDTSAERVVPAPVPAKSETEEPGSTTEPVAAPRESRRPIQRPLGARPLPQINTATGAVENQDATAKKSQPVSGATQDKTAGSATAEAEQITKQPTTLPRPSGRPLPTPGQGSQAPRASSRGDQGRISARPAGPTPVRRKPPGTGEGQSTPLRESQRDNLPSTSQGAPQEIKPRSEPPKPLPRNTQGPAQGGNKQPGTPAPTPRKSQGDSLGGQARNLKSEHDKRLGSSPDKSVTRKGEDEPPPIPPRDKRNP